MNPKNGYMPASGFRPDSEGERSKGWVRRLIRAVGIVLTFVGSACPGAETWPAVTPPEGATALVRDSAANFWALVPGGNGERELRVLPAQAPGKWIAATIPGLPAKAWRVIAPPLQRQVNG